MPPGLEDGEPGLVPDPDGGKIWLPGAPGVPWPEEAPEPALAELFAGPAPLGPLGAAPAP